MMLAAQDWRCAICKTTDPGRYEVFRVDHNHGTGEVRKLLCERCNVGIGHFQESTAILQAAIDYLKEFKLEAEDD